TGSPGSALTVPPLPKRGACRNSRSRAARNAPSSSIPFAATQSPTRSKASACCPTLSGASHTYTARGCHSARLRAFFPSTLAGGKVHGNDRSESLALVVEGVVFARFGFLLRKGIAIDGQPVLYGRRLYPAESAQSRSLFQQFVGIQFRQPEALPPAGFVFSPV